MGLFGMGRQGYGSSRGGGGFSLRILAGLAIAVIGIITYYSRTQTNPVTGEKQRREVQFPYPCGKIGHGDARLDCL